MRSALIAHGPPHKLGTFVKRTPAIVLARPCTLAPARTGESMIMDQEELNEQEAIRRSSRSLTTKRPSAPAPEPAAGAPVIELGEAKPQPELAIGPVLPSPVPVAAGGSLV